MNDSENKIISLVKEFLPSDILSQLLKLLYEHDMEARKDIVNYARKHNYLKDEA